MFCSYIYTQRSLTISNTIARKIVTCKSKACVEGVFYQISNLQILTCKIARENPNFYILNGILFIAYNHCLDYCGANQLDISWNNAHITYKLLVYIIVMKNYSMFAK